MITVPELAAEALGAYLGDHLSRRFASTHADLTELIPSIARLSLECIGNSDALYHNVEHTMLVTLVGYEIMKGRSLLTPTYPSDYAHLLVACLLHDIGYVRGILNGDGADGYVIDTKGNKAKLPRGSSDAALLPYHVDRSKLFAMDRIAKIESCSMPSASRTPSNLRAFLRRRDAVDADNEEGLLVRAADLIGQLGDPHYLRKANALYYEFEEVGMNRQLGYSFAGRSYRSLSAVLLEQRFIAHTGRHPLFESHVERSAVDRQPLQQRLPRRARSEPVRAATLSPGCRRHDSVTQAHPSLLK